MRNIFKCINNNGKVTINGTTYTGSVCIDDNNVVYCNGKDTGNNVGRNITISIEGDVELIETQGAINVKGDVGEINTQGSIDVKGNVQGNIKTMGPVNVGGNVTGHINTMGPITVRSNIK